MESLFPQDVQFRIEHSNDKASQFLIVLSFVGVNDDDDRC